MSPKDLSLLAYGRFGHGWQSALARALGVHVSTVWAWANSRRPISSPNEIAVRAVCSEQPREG